MNQFKIAAHPQSEIPRDVKTEAGTLLATRWQIRTTAEFAEKLGAVGLGDAGAIVSHLEESRAALHFNPRSMRTEFEGIGDEVLENARNGFRVAEGRSWF